MIEIISGVWAAGELKTFHINGEYLEILEAQYPLDVMLMDRSGAQLSVMKKSEASFFSRPKEGFNTIQISSAQAQSIRIFVGSGDAGTRRISSTVQVVDGGRARTIAGAAYVAVAGAAAGVGQYAGVGMFNISTGVRAVVKQLRLGGDVTGNWDLKGVGVTFGLPSVAPAAKLVGGADSVSIESRSLNNGGAAVVFTKTFDRIYVGANQQVQLRFEEPIVLNPGAGLVITNIAGLGAAANIFMAAEFSEESLT